MGTVIFLFTLHSCADSKLTVTDQVNAPHAVPDYANLNHWAAHPGKWDFSDSLPKPYRPLVQDTGVDVFFVHPTSYTDERAVNEKLIRNPEERNRWNADLTDAGVNHSTDKGTILYQASVFNRFRVYAPRYRQAHIKAFYIPDSLARPMFDMAYEDARSAFLYYLQHENRGRPFIIASHSQGTLHAARLLKELVEGTAIQKQLVAAYLIGLPLRSDYFLHIPVCTSPASTGCVVSWRTFKEGYMPEYVKKESYKAIVVNPLTWTIEEEKAERLTNRGAVLYRFNKPKAANVSTMIHGNILWSSKPRFFGNLFFTRKNYHVGDINLFWKDIRDNTDERVNAFRQHP